MTPPGNYVCIFFIVLETFLINGVFAGWGILTAMLKEDKLFFHEDSWNGLKKAFRSVDPWSTRGNSPIMWSKEADQFWWFADLCSCKSL